MTLLERIQTVAVPLALSLVVTLAAPIAVFAAQPTVNLGTTSGFAVLAGTTITNTGATTIGGSAGGSLGLYPGTSIPGLAQITRSGAVHISDTVARKAKDDLVAAYNDAAGRIPVTTIPTELGGTTLSPGVYDSESGTFQVTGTLTLDAQGDPDAVFVFKTSSTLITASDSTVSLINSGRYCRVFWQVGSSATLGTNSRFVGHIFALTSISAQTGATVQGQLLARNGAVTLERNTIMNGICVVGPAVHVSKLATPRALTSGSGSVTYTYMVSNSGTVDLSGVEVTDDKLNTVEYVSGDTNGDNLLQPDEVWKYTGTMRLTATTTNIATASATGGEAVVTDTASLRVVVSTVNGAVLPNTASPWFNLLLVGFVLIVLGVLGWWGTARKMHE